MLSRSALKCRYALLFVVPAWLAAQQPATTTPIKHVVVIFQENVSFDHYFATYPTAKNPAGQPAFHARSNTPTVNGLNTPALLFQNPNQHNPFRLARSQAVTCDQDHSYTDEQVAFEWIVFFAIESAGGQDFEEAMDRFGFDAGGFR